MINEASTALAAVKAGLEIAKIIKDTDKQFDEAVLRMQIVDLMGSLTEAKSAILDLQISLEAKEKELTELKSTIGAAIEELVEFDGFKYRKNAEGKPVGLPICPTCFTRDGKLISTIKLGLAGVLEITKCPVCDTELGTSVRKF